jgi:predicted YcjX-like family ATPase
MRSETEAAIFRGDGLALPETDADWRFARFRPPLIGALVDGKPAPLPHTRMDSALEFLLGDKMV